MLHWILEHVKKGDRAIGLAEILLADFHLDANGLLFLFDGPAFTTWRSPAIAKVGSLHGPFLPRKEVPLKIYKFLQAKIITPLILAKFLLNSCSCGGGSARCACCRAVTRGHSCARSACSAKEQEACRSEACMQKFLKAAQRCSSCAHAWGAVYCTLSAECWQRRLCSYVETLNLSDHMAERPL